MLAIKPRVWLLGMLGMLLVGSFATASAEAQGPFFYHRKANSQQIKGVKISAQAPELIAGSGGEEKLVGNVGVEIEIKSKQVQIKGEIYNNALQGQAKIQITYIEPVVVKPANCLVTVGVANTIKVYGHQAWTWDGTEGQRTEQPQEHQKPDWIFLPTELQQGATELPAQTFTELKFSKKPGVECPALLTGTPQRVKGSLAAAIEPPNVGEWAITETQKFLPNGTKQHFWNGKENIGAKTQLTIGGSTNEATLSGETEAKVLPRQVTQEQQEIAHYES